MAGPLTFNRPRRSLVDDLTMRTGNRLRPRLADEIGAPPAFEGPKAPTQLQRLESERNTMNRPMTKKQGLLEAIAAFAPAAIGGIFGGEDAAAGALQGSAMAINQRNAGREQRRKTLSEEIEAERGREFQGQRDEAQLGLQRERLSTDVDQFNKTMGWNKENAAADRGFRTSERLGTQDFTTGQNKEQRNFVTGERLSSQDFTTGQNRDERSWRAGESAAERSFRTGERMATQDFTGKENAADRRSREGMSLADIVSREKLAGDKNGGVTANANASQTIDDALSTIGELKQGAIDGTFGGGVGSSQAQAVGFKGPLGTLTGPWAGSAAATYTAKVDALKAQLVLPKLQMLRGLGAMSDREFATLTSAATSLSRDMSEEAFNAELRKLENGLNKAKQNLMTGSGGPLRQGTTVPLGIIEVISPDGVIGNIPFEDWPSAQKEGYQRAPK